MTGSLVFSRVLDDPGRLLDRAAADSFSGVATVEPRTTLVRDTERTYYVAFEDGVPTDAVTSDASTAGAAVLPLLADAAPCRVELRADATRSFSDDAAVDPATLARTLDRDGLAADYPPAAATATAPPEETGEPAAEPQSAVDALDAFLADEARVTELRERAREEAESRAAEWGFDVTDGESRT